MVSSKQIIKINKKHGGTLINKNNLDYAVERANKEKNIYKSNAYLLRGIVVSHPFLDGNKSSATEIVLKRFKEEKIKCNEKMFSKGIINLAKTNETSINKIQRRLMRWCTKK